MKNKTEVKIKLIGGINVEIITDEQVEKIVEAFTTKQWVRINNYYINTSNVLHFNISIIN